MRGLTTSALARRRGRAPGTGDTVRPRARAVAIALVLSCVVLSGTLVGCGRPDFDENLAFEFLERQCEFGPRPPGSQEHEEMRDWLVAELQRRADAVSVQEFTAADSTGRQYELTNVIASFHMEATERVLFGAHWDTRPVAEKDPDPAARARPIVGANDGASGVAVLLALADMMSADRPELGVDLVFFDLEDAGKAGGFSSFCLGSAHFAATMGGYAPSYAVVVDMIGDGDLSIPVEVNSAQACPDVVNRVWSAAERVGSGSFVRETGPSMFDDHIPLIQAGVPAALVIDFEYPFWHTHEDTPDKCSPQSLGEVGRVLAELVYRPRRA